MAVFSFSAGAGEALWLGLATGPVCLASCGPVVTPWMLVQPEGVLRHVRRLSLFLAARLAGYLSFAVAAWLLGSALPRSWTERSWEFGTIELFLAAGLVFYAAGWPRPRCAARRSASRLVEIGAPPRDQPSGALALGFLTGINLCPPFLVAGVRAAQMGSLAAALLFFVCFFAGTAAWFVPFLALGLVRRTPALMTVARLLAVLLACWYGFSGVMLLVGRLFHE
jgi:sulfite exporter TauE/SafE